MRFYVSNHSYPELREMDSPWRRHVTWWRAFRSALGDLRFWRFFGIELLLLAGWFVLHRVLTAIASETLRPLLDVGIGLAAITGWGVLALSWGGDLMRPHLRRVSALARDACPCCGHQLSSQIAEAADRVRCPECGESSPRSAFEPPYRIPGRFRATAWGRR
jgi:hypothetical protein